MSFPISQLPPKAEVLPIEQPATAEPKTLQQLLEESKPKSKTVEQLMEETASARKAVFSAERFYRAGYGFVIRGVTGVTSENNIAANRTATFTAAMCDEKTVGTFIQEKTGNSRESRDYEITPNSPLTMQELFPLLMQNCRSVAVGDPSVNFSRLAKRYLSEPNDIDEWTVRN
jgi:hypothetical protein